LCERQIMHERARWWRARAEQLDGELAAAAAGADSPPPPAQHGGSSTKAAAAQRDAKPKKLEESYAKQEQVRRVRMLSLSLATS
jgi:hypothetical protein